MSKVGWWRIGLMSVLVVALSVTIGLTQGQAIKNPDTMVYSTHGPAETLDPAYAYDTASGEIIFNVYENLVRWPYGNVDADEVDLNYSLDPSQLQPMLATDWTVSEDGKTYTFTIRKGVKFHEGGDLTPSDVEYTFERAMLQDRDGGPIWMFLEPLTGYATLRQVAAAVLGREVDDLHTLSPEEQAQIYNEMIDPAVEVEGDTVVFNLPKAYPPFITILAHGGGWGAILDKEWAIETAGAWDGQPDTWEQWWNPGEGEAAQESELYDVMNGTGPFKLNRWDVGVEVVLDRFDGYWREPARLKQAIIKKTSEWSDRLLAFQNGDADIVQVPRQNQAQVEGMAGAVNVHHLPTLSMNPVAFFTAPVVTEGNEYIPEGPWDGLGIPPDFFADINVRKAFIMAFDYDTYIEDIYLGEGYKTHGPIPQAFDWAYNPDERLVWGYDPAEAEQRMRLARNGEIWEKGFNLTILYNEGNEPRRVAAEILEANLEAMNPKFQITVRAVPWNTYVSQLVTSKMPLFIIGWLADFPDPHNFAQPFVQSTGTFSGWQGEYMIDHVFKPHFDPLVSAGMSTTDQDLRKVAYYEISELAHDLAVDLWLPQAEGLLNMRDWVQNNPFNPMFPGWTGGGYFYPMYKAYE